MEKNGGRTQESLKRMGIGVENGWGRNQEGLKRNGIGVEKE